MLGHAGQTPGAGTSFVGREDELAALRTALDERRLITLTGPGGVGKTRLARQALTAAAGPTGPFPEGIHWADLSPLPDGALLLDTVADALDLADHTSRSLAEAVRDWIGDRRVLLVLDCCEHLTDAVRDLVGALLDRAPRLVLLLTSREPLGLAAEHVLDLGPLPYAPHAYEALALFTARARAVRPAMGPPWTPAHLAAARAICARLEGVPLALELAAAQLTDHTVEELADRLTRRIGALPGPPDARPPRHRALRTAIGWSHEWCTPRERLLWLRLSVFGGAFDERAARAVCSAPPLAPDEVPALLEALVAKSVVRRTGPPGTHRMLDTIREYGALWRDEAGETDALRDRHAAYFLDLVRAAERDWLGPRQREVYRRIAAGHGDICAALDHHLATDPARAVELAGRVGFFWACCGHLHTARAYLERALAAADPREVDAAGRLRALWALGVALVLQSRQDEAHRIAVGCEALVRARSDLGLDAVLDAAYLLGLSHLVAGRPLAARSMADHVLETHPAEPFDSAPRMRCHLLRVFALTGMGLFGDARAEAEELRAGCVSRQEYWIRSYIDYQLALISLFEGRPAESAGHARAMLESKRELRETFGTALAFDVLASARAAAGDGTGAAHAFGAGHAYWGAVGHALRGTPELGPVREEFERAARRALGERAYEAAFQEGVRHGHAQRAEAAPTPPPNPPPPPGGGGGRGPAP
ncbi:AAA family ATPase, partial [Streptomyces sp. NPDC048606]|uniref:ATP-binding protein n=1 Tax=Streptomyces sp. NPDC048606 TaxID=3154726 RepID=UPI0034244ECE